MQVTLHQHPVRENTDKQNQTVSTQQLTLALPSCLAPLSQSKGVLPSPSWSLRSPPASSMPLTTEGLQEYAPAWTGVLQSSQRLEESCLYINMLSSDNYHSPCYKSANVNTRSGTVSLFWNAQSSLKSWLGSFPVVISLEKSHNSVGLV